MLRYLRVLPCRTHFIQSRLLHSETLNRYFTNYEHKKVCPRCGKPNILTVLKCTACESILLDAHVKPVQYDLLVEAGLSKNGVPGLVELHRSFDTLVVRNPHSVGVVHLLVTPKSTMYGMQSLRRKHMKMLRRMYELGLGCLENEIKSFPPAFRDQVRDFAIWGFNYPGEYNQLALHIVVPPVKNLEMFKAPYFYPFDRVVADLEAFGKVNLHKRGQRAKGATDAQKQSGESEHFDKYLAGAAAQHQRAKELLGAALEKKDASKDVK